MSCLEVDCRISRRYGDFRVKSLVHSVCPIPAEGKGQILEESEVQAEFPGVGAFGFEVSDRVVGFRLPSLGGLVIFVGRRSEVTRIWSTDRTEGCAKFEIVNGFRHRKHFGNDGGKTHRRIEERLGGGVRKLRSPVVSACEGEVEHILPASLDRGEDGLGLLRPAFLACFLLGAVYVIDIEDIRYAVLADRSTVAQLVIAVV